MSNKTSAVVKTNPRKAVMIGCGFVGSAYAERSFF